MLLFLAVTAVVISFIGDDSYSRLQSLKSNLGLQEEKKNSLKSEVLELRSEVYGLQTNDRVLERAARSELRMQSPDEILVIFD
jgi:cell division protein FtsB